MSSRQEKTAIKRANGQIACSECSRLKLKCDRRLPACGSCVRRGCEYICPNGTLPQVKRKSAATTSSTDHEDDLRARIQQLEDALAILQSSVSSDRHPLLRHELLQIKFGKKPKLLNTTNPEVLADSLGTLAIGTNGDVKYFGPSAGPESLFQAGAEVLDEAHVDSLCSDDVAKYRQSFPFPPIPDILNLSYDHLLEYLPPKPRAWSLCETYLQQGRLKERFIERDELINDLLIPVYNRGDPRLHSQESAFSAHKVAALLLVFSIGAMVDLTLPFDSEEAEKYFQLGRAALSLHSVLNSPELATVQALNLLAFCHMQGGKRYDIDAASMLAALAIKHAESIGLHRESPRWNFDAKTLHRRRHVWWEAFAMDALLSLGLGRPPTIRPSYIDCQYPIDDEAIVDEKGDTQSGPDRWRWSFAREIIAQVIEATLSPNISYATVLDLDRKLREFPFPPRYQTNLTAFFEEDDIVPYDYLKKHWPTQIRTATALHIHRNFFARVLLDHAADPLGSPYAASFLASCKAASAIISVYVKHITRWPELLMRWWPIWTSLLAASMVAGSIVIRCPESTVAPKAYMELGLAVAIFERGAEHSPRARSGLVILKRLMTRATEVFSRRHENNRQPATEESNLDEELEIFAGHTKVFVSKVLSKHRLLPRGPTPPSTESSPPQGLQSSPQYMTPNGSESFQRDIPTAYTFEAATTFSTELLNPIIFGDENSPGSSFGQPEGTWEVLPGLNNEWLAFMQQSGLLDHDTSVMQI